MNTTADDQNDTFENVFYYFAEALKVLASDAETQCEEMDNYNTPWEIQRDVSGGGIGALRISATHLSWEQCEKIVDLVANLRRLPKEALSVPHINMTGQVGCVTAMSHPAWKPLRQEAEQLLQLLEPAIQQNKSFFQSQDL